MKSWQIYRPCDRHEIDRSRLQDHWPRGHFNSALPGIGMPIRPVSFYWRCSSRRECAILRIRDYACEPCLASDRVRFRETIEPGTIDTRLREIMSIIASTFYPYLEDLFFEKSLDSEPITSHCVAMVHTTFHCFAMCDAWTEINASK